MLRKSFSLIAALLLSGCFPLSGDQIAELTRNLKDDPNSFCMEIVGSGGAGTVVVPSPVVPGGGYGYGRITLGRSGPGSSLSCGAEGIKIVPESNREYHSAP